MESAGLAEGETDVANGKAALAQMGMIGSNTQN
jgi:hypothetical protein